MSGTIISIRRPTSSTFISRVCAPRSTRASTAHCCTPFVAQDTWSVTAFGKLIRTTAFRLTLVYLLLFAIFAASLLGYFAWNTRRMITEQIAETVNSELVELTSQFQSGGIRGLASAIEARTLRPCLLYTSPSPRDGLLSRMPSS